MTDYPQIKVTSVQPGDRIQIIDETSSGKVIHCINIVSVTVVDGYEHCRLIEDNYGRQHWVTGAKKICLIHRKNHAPGDPVDTAEQYLSEFERLSDAAQNYLLHKGKWAKNTRELLHVLRRKDREHMDQLRKRDETIADLNNQLNNSDRASVVACSECGTRFQVRSIDSLHGGTIFQLLCQKCGGRK